MGISEVLNGVSVEGVLVNCLLKVLYGLLIFGQDHVDPAHAVVPFVAAWILLDQILDHLYCSCLLIFAEG